MIAVLCVLAALALVILGLLVRAKLRAGAQDAAAPTPTAFVPPEAEPGGVTTLSFEKAASDAIRLTWEEPEGAARVAVMRRAAVGGEWETRAALDAGACVYTDMLSDTAPQQYLYRIDLLSAAGDTLAQGLRTVLRESYGISAVMTRETDSITIDGYTDGELDNQHLSLRGSFAAGQDLFLSLHSNANLDNANGYPTCNQPLGINKTLVFVNRVALGSERYMRLANAIGSRVTAVNAAAGLTTTGDAFTPGDADALIPWDDPFNDSLDTPGTVCYRDGENHEDYYGVLRGAASVGVPGLIVEHGFHTVAEVRKAAMEGDLVRRWAEADAAGIAEGFGFLLPAV